MNGIEIRVVESLELSKLLILNILGKVLQLRIVKGWCQYMKSGGMIWISRRVFYNQAVKREVFLRHQELFTSWDRNFLIINAFVERIISN